MFLIPKVKVRLIGFALVWGLSLSILGSCTLHDDRTFVEHIGIESSKNGDLFLVVCGESDGLQSADGYLDGVPFSVMLGDVSRASSRVKISGKMRGYKTSPFVAISADTLLLTSIWAAAGFPGMFEESFDLQRLEPGYVLDQDGHLTQASTWADRNRKCR